MSDVYSILLIEASLLTLVTHTAGVPSGAVIPAIALVPAWFCNTVVPDTNPVVAASLILTACLLLTTCLMLL